MVDYLLDNIKVTYEVAAIFFDLIIVIFLHLISGEDNKTARSFRCMAYCALLITLAEVFAPLDLYLPRGYGWSVLRDYIEGTQFLTEHFVLYFFALYITRLTNHRGPRFILYVNNLVLLYSIILMTTNPFTHLVFNFDPVQWRFTSGPLYIWGGYAPAVYFGLYALVIFIREFKNMMQRERYAIFFTIMMVFGVSAVQPTLKGQIKLVALFTSLGVFILYLALETRDYQKLLYTQNKLMEAREEAASANKAKSVFIASLSHEIRTPMNAILGINEIILQNSKEANVLNYSRDMKKAGTALLSIINDVLDVSKMEAGQFTIVEENYHLDEMVDNLAKKLADGLTNKKVECQLRIKEDLPDELYGDEERLNQVLSNIIDNAIKYTKRGIIVFDVSGEVEDDFVHLDFTVTDTGVGIKEEDMADLFKNFKRMDMENNRSIEGTGLGLSIAKQILSLMGGTIEVKSTYGKGSIFTVHISQKIMSDMTVQQHKQNVLNGVADKKRIKHAQGKRFLVVDDNEMNLKVADAFLNQSKATVKTMKDSQEALKELATFKYDLIFLDDLMPGLNGPALLLRTRRSEANPNSHTPAVIMTAKTSKRDRKEYERMGFEGYIAKPMVEEEVAEVVNSLI
ncbi:MAG: response regulator [Lachnospiraceae bacterium]|nr:response regulator [Lachnospiraceae bacterium]